MRCGGAFSSAIRPRAPVVFDAQQLDELERIGYLPVALGTILCRAGEWPVRHFGIRPPSPVFSPSPAANGERARTATAPLLSTAPLAPFPTAGVNTPVLVFTQELAQPSDVITVACESKAAFLVATGAATGVSLQMIPPSRTGDVTGAAIDSLSIYAISPSSLQICAQEPLDPAQTAHDWAGAEMIPRGLTLHETDPLADHPRRRVRAGSRAPDRRRDPLRRRGRPAGRGAASCRCPRRPRPRLRPGDALARRSRRCVPGDPVPLADCAAHARSAIAASRIAS
jgi:hypothetical protein